MSRAQGIDVDFVKVLGLMLSNGLAALARAVLPVSGLCGCQRQPRRYRYRPHAVIIGVCCSAVFRTFAMRLLGVSLGAVVYYLVIQVVLNLGLNTNA